MSGFPNPGAPQHLLFAEQSYLAGNLLTQCAVNHAEMWQCGSGVERATPGTQRMCRPVGWGRYGTGLWPCDAASAQCNILNPCSLCAALQGAAGPALLRSYDAERRPVALANTALSVANWRAAMRIPQARSVLGNVFGDNEHFLMVTMPIGIGDDEHVLMVTMPLGIGDDEHVLMVTMPIGHSMQCERKARWSSHILCCIVTCVMVSGRRLADRFSQFSSLCGRRWAWTLQLPSCSARPRRPASPACCPAVRSPALQAFCRRMADVSSTLMVFNSEYHEGKGWSAHKGSVKGLQTNCNSAPGDALYFSKKLSIMLALRLYTTGLQVLPRVCSRRA